MRKLLILLMAGLFSSVIIAQDEESTEEVPIEYGPLDAKYMGTHGMVLMNSGGKLFASNLTSYDSPHDVQLVYRVKASTSAVNIMVKDADLVTIKPEPFNIQRLIRGETISVIADVYLGHYDRGAMMTHEQIEFSFETQLYVRELTELAPSSRTKVYDSIDIGNDERILIHQITESPSYDQLILLYTNQTCLTQFNTSSAIPQQGETFMALSMCGPMKPLYYDAEALQ